MHVGDELLAINGHGVEDVLDYRYWSYEPRLTLRLRSARTGEEYEVKLRKGEGEDLGLDFEEYLMDKPWGCSNHCLFCFIDQLPRGLRRTLYFKDDDARLFFPHGQLYNAHEPLRAGAGAHLRAENKPHQRLRPRHGPGDARRSSWGTRKPRTSWAPCAASPTAGITVDCQIVCCPGYNDREQLSRSMRELAELHPGVGSVSIVPVGLTKHREKLAKLTPFDRDSAAETIDRVEAYAAECLKERGSRIFWCSDELYLKAGREVPPDEYYEEYSQLENGVGLMRLLETEFMAALDFTEPDEGSGEAFTIATGVAAAPLLEKLLQTGHKKCAKIKGQVVAIVNDFFGHTIDVAGLVTGGDLIAQLRGRELGRRLLIPHTMLRHGEGVFLDDVTLEQVSAELGVPVDARGRLGGRAALGHAWTGHVRKGRRAVWPDLL